MDDDLFNAIEDENSILVRQLLLQGVNPNQYNQDQETPLGIAIAHGNLPIIKLLINHNANVNMLDGQQSSPLSGAIQMNRMDIVQTLLEFGAEIDGLPNERTRPLTEAVYNGYSELTQFLLDQGANPFYGDRDGDTLLNVVCLTPLNWEDANYEKTLINLLNYRDRDGRGLDIDAFNADGDTPLAVVAHYENRNLIMILLDYGANPNLINWDDIKPEIREFINLYLSEPIKEPESL